MNWSPATRPIALVLGIALGVLAFVPSGQTSEPLPKIRAVLIWGTNDPKPANPKLKDLDERTRKKLRAVFKWKDYYEVNRKEFLASKQAGKKVRLSPKCQIAVQDLDKSTIDVRLYGEGKLVVTKRQIMKRGELLVLAGEDKNDTAWFVVITLAPEKKE
jgi:hypothetical protein